MPVPMCIHGWPTSVLVPCFRAHTLILQFPSWNCLHLAISLNFVVRSISCGFGWCWPVACGNLQSGTRQGVYLHTLCRLLSGCAGVTAATLTVLGVKLICLC